MLVETTTGPAARLSGQCALELVAGDEAHVDHIRQAHRRPTTLRCQRSACMARKARALQCDSPSPSVAAVVAQQIFLRAKPELEIFADDVQCAHGATSGAIDEQLLFYLMARGIPRKQAERCWSQAFFGEALRQIGHEACARR
jgi:hypothetical protein